MSENTERLVPTPGQTIGPFYGYALPYEGGEFLVDRSHPNAVCLHGTVYDGHGTPVPDSMLEIWQADATNRTFVVKDECVRTAIIDVDNHNMASFGRGTELIEWCWP